MESDAVQTKVIESIHEPRLSLPKAILLTSLVFLLVQAVNWLVFGKYEFPNWPEMRGIAVTAYSSFWMVDVGLSYAVSHALDFTNPAPRGIIATVLAFITFKLARLKVKQKR